jgi:prepilin-type N-terminal cleavage/methylation domain-containing protein
MNKGFTLMELLLVVGMMSLFSTAFFFNVTEAKRKADDADVIAEADQIETAILLYQDENNGNVPTSTTANNQTTYTYREGAPDGYFEEAMGKLVSGGYLREIPESPSGEAYTYIVSEDGKDAVLAVTLNYASSSSSSESNSCSIITEQAESEYPTIEEYKEYISDIISALEQYKADNGDYPRQPCAGGACPLTFLSLVNTYLSSYGISYLEPDPEWNIRSGYPWYYAEGSTIEHQWSCGEEWDGEPVDYMLYILTNPANTNLDFLKYYNGSLQYSANYCYMKDFSYEAPSDESGSLCDGQSDTDYCTCI